MSGRGTLLALAILVLASASFASGSTRIRPDTWGARIERVEELLRSEEWKQARSLAENLVEEMAQGVTSGERASRAMGSAVAQLALAEAGLERAEDAFWHWGVAVSLRRDLTELDLEVYGAAGRLLERRRAAWEPLRGLAEADWHDEPVHELVEGIEPPRKKFAPFPQATTALRARGGEEVILIVVIVDENGTLHDPRILHHEYPGYAYVVGETLRRWRFKPARIEGEPISSFYRMRIRWSDNR